MRKHKNNLAFQSPPYESSDLAKRFAKEFASGDYVVTTLDPYCRRTPDGIFRGLKKRLPYCATFNDAKAQLRYFSLDFKDADRNICTMPIGVFGVSQKNEMCFPLLINSFWRYFLMVNKGTLNELCRFQSTELAEICFAKLLEYREHLIRNIFIYYKSAFDGYDHVMAWKTRGETSLTRRVAESVGYERFCTRENVEVYSSSPPSDKRRRYIFECLERWGFRNDVIAGFIQPYDPPSCHRSLEKFLTGIFPINEDIAKPSITLVAEND